MYEFPEGLAKLKNWLEAAGYDVRSAKSERQVLFFACKISALRVKFPTKGNSCHLALQKIQDQLPERKPEAAKKVKPVASAPTNRAFEIIIYTDGACEPNPGPGGWGFAVYRDGREIHCDYSGEADTTNNRMEVQAVIEALGWLQGKHDRYSTPICSDSQYVVKGCNHWRQGWKKKGWKRGPNKPLQNVDLWQEIDKLLSQTPCTIEWVKGHAGVEGNERADELAVMGMPEPETDMIAEQLNYSV